MYRLQEEKIESFYFTLSKILILYFWDSFFLILIRSWWLKGVYPPPPLWNLDCTPPPTSEGPLCCVIWWYGDRRKNIVVTSFLCYREKRRKCVRSKQTRVGGFTGWASINSIFPLNCCIYVFKKGGGARFTGWAQKSSIFLLNLYIYFACLLSVRMFVSNKRQNGWTERTQILCGTSRGPREGLWMIKISKLYLHQNWIFIKFLKILKILEFFFHEIIRELFFVLFYNVPK